MGLFYTAYTYTTVNIYTLHVCTHNIKIHDIRKLKLYKAALYMKLSYTRDYCIRFSTACIWAQNTPINLSLYAQILRRERHQRQMQTASYCSTV